jgi:RNA recognition motif-containing protein
VAKKLFVGNLPHEITNDELQKLFEEFGTVDSANVIMDRATGRSKGFGFVEMSSEEEAEKATEAMNGKEVGGRALTVNEARPPKERNGGFRNNNRSRGGFGGDRRRY